LSKRQVSCHLHKVYSEASQFYNFGQYGARPKQHRPDLRLPSKTQHKALHLALKRPGATLDVLLSCCKDADVEISGATLGRLLQHANLKTSENRRGATAMIQQARAAPCIWLTLPATVHMLETATSANMLTLAVNEASGYVWGDIIKSYEPAALS
jgi:hypothetical protein